MLYLVQVTDNLYHIMLYRVQVTDKLYHIMLYQHFYNFVLQLLSVQVKYYFHARFMTKLLRTFFCLNQKNMIIKHDIHLYLQVLQKSLTTEESHNVVSSTSYWQTLSYNVVSSTSHWQTLSHNVVDKVCQWLVLDTTLCDRVCQWLVLDTTLCDKGCQCLVELFECF
jgi:uncharacterized protein with von Willebrand factor type A (vWA) domain